MAKASGESRGQAGELHPLARGDGDVLTTNHGPPIADNQSSLRPGPRGPTLLEDFILREKITLLDHERIFERVVHARGYGAHGYFQPAESAADLTKAAFLQDPAVKTPVFVRFSTMPGSQGSMDTARDVRGFAVKFYTRQGSFDLVGNNIPVFFIHDASRFLDLVHSVKPAPDCASPQARPAPDTFWDFVSLMPESMHMLMWMMSDRAIPRSFRMMEGFGVHTFEMINAKDEVTFVKFHWRPRLGAQSLLWDECLKLGGADPDFHRRDLWTAIENGDFPEYELAVQAFDEETAGSFDFDILDPTKIIPEEVVPLRVLGKMVLNRNVDNFFAETEQVAFCPSHVVPGIDFTDDPLLQGRLLADLDAERKLGGPSVRSESFADHYSQARLFWRSMTAPERRHIVGGFSFELGRVDSVAVRRRMLGHLHNIDEELARRVEEALGMAGEAEEITPVVPVKKDVEPSMSLSILKRLPPTLKGRKVGALVTDGADGRLLKTLEDALRREGAMLEVVAPTRDGVRSDTGERIEVTHALTGGPSVLFDSVVLLPAGAGCQKLVKEAAAVDWLRDAFAHLKVIGHVPAAAPLFEAAGVQPDADEGVVPLDDESLDTFTKAARRHRIWDREQAVRSPG